MKTLAVYNVKGGVGKTATSINLAYLSAQRGQATLVWDLDPQGAASWTLQAKTAESADKTLWRGDTPVAGLIQNTAYPKLDVLPADLASRNVDVWLRKGEVSHEALRQRLKPLAEKYALVVLDCPPSLSHLADNIFAAADLVLVPVVPAQLSLRALKALIDYFKERDLPRTKLKPFWSMVDRRRLLHKLLLEQPPKPMRDVCKAWIPYSSAVERMGEQRAPLEASEPASFAAESYRALWKELSPLLRKS